MATSPEVIPGKSSVSTFNSAIAMASPFKLWISTVDPSLAPCENLAIPGLANDAPWETAAAAPSLTTIFGSDTRTLSIGEISFLIAF